MRAKIGDIVVLREHFEGEPSNISEEFDIPLDMRFEVVGLRPRREDSIGRTDANLLRLKIVAEDLKLIRNFSWVPNEDGLLFDTWHEDWFDLYKPPALNCAECNSSIEIIDYLCKRCRG